MIIPEAVLDLPELGAGPARLLAVRRFALRLMACHGLAGWSFQYNRRKTILGLCAYDRRSIELSSHLVERNGRSDLELVIEEVMQGKITYEFDPTAEVDRAKLMLDED